MKKSTARMILNEARAVRLIDGTLPGRPTFAMYVSRYPDRLINQAIRRLKNKRGVPLICGQSLPKGTNER
jgi:hypothetical protein